MILTAALALAQRGQHFFASFLPSSRATALSSLLLILTVFPIVQGKPHGQLPGRICGMPLMRKAADSICAQAKALRYT
jgi:hypothetical protein